MNSHSARTASDIALRADGIHLVFGEGDSVSEALRGVSIDFERGRITAIMGDADSGKWALMRCLAGFEPATSGGVLVNGQDLTVLPKAELGAVRRNSFGFISTAVNFIPTLTALENIEFHARVNGIQLDQRRVQKLISEAGLTDYLRSTASDLSEVNRQMVACTRALAGAPTVVFAAEPAGQLGSGAGEQVLSFLRNAASTFGQTIVLLTDDPGVAAWADRVVFLSDGSLLTELSNPNEDEIRAVLGSAFNRQATPAALETDAAPIATLAADDEVEPAGIAMPLPDAEPTAVTGPSTDTAPPLSDPELPEDVAPALEVELDSLATFETLFENYGVLPGTLDELAPPPRLSGEQAKLVRQAQEILDRLPGPIAEADE